MTIEGAIVDLLYLIDNEGVPFWVKPSLQKIKETLDAESKKRIKELIKGRNADVVSRQDVISICNILAEKMDDDGRVAVEQVRDAVKDMRPYEADKEYDVKTITRGNCMACGKELTDGVFFCKECEEKGRKEGAE